MIARPHLPALTSVRFLAALSVVFFHINTFSNFSPVWSGLLESGKAGVSFFFILSGFILTYTYFDRLADGVSWQKYGKFIKARFARIYPLHVLSLLLITPISLLLVWQYPALLQQQMYSHLHWQMMVGSWVANLGLFQIYIPIMPFEQLWNGPAWSIACEFAFYLCFPAVLPFLAKKVGRGWRPLLLAAALFAISTVMFVAAVALIGSKPTWFTAPDAGWDIDFFPYRLPIFRISEFLIGCSLGLLMVMPLELRPRVMVLLSQRQWRNVLLMAGIFLTIASLTIQLPVSSHIVTAVWREMHRYVLFIPGFSCIILALAAGPTFAHKVLENRTLVILGEASYALYLLHWIPLSTMSYKHLLGETIPLWQSLVVVVTVTGFSVVTYYLIEKPARKWINSLTWQDSRLRQRILLVPQWFGMKNG